MAGPPYAYPSVISWPTGLPREERTRIVVEAMGLEPFAAAQMVAKPPPLILGRVPEAAGPNVLGVLRKAGVTAFAPTDSQLATVPKAAAMAKGLEAAVGAPEPMYMVEYWRSESNGFRAADLFLIVRARIGKILRAVAEQAAARVNDPLTTNPYALGDIGPAVRTEITDLLDLYLRVRSDDAPQATTWRRIRIDGRKFNYDVLGANRGLSDNVNADQLAVLLGEQAPDAIIDTEFGSFQGPPWMPHFAARPEGGGVAGATKRDDSRLFDFYSAWSYLKFRALLGV